ncbi:GTP cyclohydrolase II [Aspergillus tubingensis]|nr:GTP cyclohydrolase II [Aspergillus tubingensis]
MSTTTKCTTDLFQDEVASRHLTFSVIPPNSNCRSPFEYPKEEPYTTKRQSTTNSTSLPKVKCIVQARIPTSFGAELRLHVYKNNVDDKSHLAYVFGDHIQSRSLNRANNDETQLDRMIRGAYKGRLWPGQTTTDDSQLSHEDLTSSKINPTLVRVHSECYTGETTWSARCDCGNQLEAAARMMATSKSGVIVYLRQEGRNIGLADKLRAYNLQDMGLDTVDANLALGRPADARSYGIATAILMDLGLGNDSGSPGIRLLTNNPDKLGGIEGPHGELTVKERVPIIPVPADSSRGWETNSIELHNYLQTKVLPDLIRKSEFLTDND